MRSEEICEVECEQRVLGTVQKSVLRCISIHRIHCQVVAGEGNSTLMHMATSLSHYCSSITCLHDYQYPSPAYLLKLPTVMSLMLTSPSDTRLM